MGADMITAIHKIPAPAPNSTDVLSGLLDAYKAIIDAATPLQIAEAMTLDHYFDVTDFFVDNDDFHEDDHDAIDMIAASPEAVAAARSRLYETAEQYAVGHCGERAELLIGGVWVAFYGGMSWGDEPFDGFGAVCALSYLPGFEVESAAPVTARLNERVAVGLAGDAGLDPNLTQWIRANPGQVRGIVEREIRARDTAITAAIDSALSGIVDEVRMAVHAEAAAHPDR